MYLLSGVVLVGVILEQALQNRSYIAGGYGSACYSIYGNAAQLGAVAGPGIHIGLGHTYQLLNEVVVHVLDGVIRTAVDGIAVAPHTYSVAVALTKTDGADGGLSSSSLGVQDLYIHHGTVVAGSVSAGAGGESNLVAGEGRVAVLEQDHSL